MYVIVIDLGDFTGVEGQSGKFHSSYIGMNVCGSAYENGCVVDGTCATVARIEYVLFCYCNRRKVLDLEEGIPHLTNVEDLQGAGETEEQQPNRAGETEPNRAGGTEPNGTGGTVPNRAGETVPNRVGGTEPNRVGGTEGVEDIQLEEEPRRAGGSVPGETVPNGIGRSGTEGTVPNGISRSGVGGTEPNGTVGPGTGGTVPNRAGGTVSNRAGKTERVEATCIVELEEGEDSTFEEAEEVPPSGEQRGAVQNSNHHVQQIPPNVNEPTVAADNIPTQDNVDPAAPPGEYPSGSLPSDWNASCRMAVSPPKSQTLRKHHVTNGQKAPPIRHSSTADQETSPHKDEVINSSILHTANRDTVSIHHRTTDHETTMTYRHSADQTVFPKHASTDQTYRHSADQAAIPKHASTDQTHRHSADQSHSQACFYRPDPSSFCRPDSHSQACFYRPDPSSFCRPDSHSQACFYRPDPSSFCRPDSHSQACFYRPDPSSFCRPDSHSQACFYRPDPSSFCRPKNYSQSPWNTPKRFFPMSLNRGHLPLSV